MNRTALIGLASLGTILSFFLFGLDTATVMGAVTTLAYAASPYLTASAGLAGIAMCDDPAAQLAQVTKDFKDGVEKLTKQQDELKEAHRLAMDAINKGAKLDKETQDNIDMAISKANESGENVTALAQKMDDLQKLVKESATKEPRNRREAMLKEADSDENKKRRVAFINRESSNLRLVFKDIVSGGSDPSFSTGLRREPFIDSMVSMERDPLRIMDLITVIPVTTDAVKYGKQVLRDNKARIVAEGDKKPYSDYKWEDATANIEVIAHLTKMTLQAIADAPRLVAEIESEMRYGLASAKEDEVLKGDGTTGHLNGIWNQATQITVPAGFDTANMLTPVDRLRLAILNIHLQRAVPDGHVLNPIDVANIELLRRDPDKGGGYLFGSPENGIQVPRLWRLPVVETPSMDVGEFMTGAFKYAVHYYQREGVSVLISTENDDDFERNKATMRVEERGGVGVRRPWAIQKGQLTGSIGAGS